MAKRLAVTAGSLQVTCSRLGISLRKISWAKGDGAIPPLGVVQRSIEHIQQGDDPARPKLTLLIQTQNRQAEFALPLRRDLIDQLALEASVRGLVSDQEEAARRVGLSTESETKSGKTL